MLLVSRADALDEGYLRGKVPVGAPQRPPLSGPLAVQKPFHFQRQEDVVLAVVGPGIALAWQVRGRPDRQHDGTHLDRLLAFRSGQFNGAPGTNIGAGGTLIAEIPVDGIEVRQRLDVWEINSPPLAEAHLEIIEGLAFAHRGAFPAGVALIAHVPGR